MAVPTVYTEFTLAQYLHSTVGGLAGELGWALGTAPDPGSYQEAVNDALVLYGGAGQAIGTATDIAKLRALAQVAVGRAAVAASLSFYQWSSDNQSFSQQQLHEAAVKFLAQAEADATAYLPAYRIVVDKLEYIQNPYTYVPDTLRTL